MRVLDAFSRLDGTHPAHHDGVITYLVAPAEGASTLELPALPRIWGGLLPAVGIPDDTFDAALLDPRWRGLLLAPGGAECLCDAGVLARITRGRAGQMPVVVDCGHAGFSRPEHLERLLDLLPPRPVVLTHGGQLNISGQHLHAAEALFRAHPHTLLETSGIYRQDFLENMTTALGAVRILYGSGHPRMDEALELRRVELLPLDEAARALVLGGNTRRVFSAA